MPHSPRGRQRPRQRSRSPRGLPSPVVYAEPPIRNSPPALTAILAGLVIGALIIGLLVMTQRKGGDDGNKSTPKDNGRLPAVSIEGARACEESRSPRINLDTPDRIKACVAAKKYAKAKLVQTLKSNKKGDEQFSCLDELWHRESLWSAWAKNPTSGAYGIAQILPDSHGVPVAEGDWKGQVDWGLNYINRRYKSACNAWKFWKCTSECPWYPGGPVGKKGGRGDPKTTWY